MYNTCTCTTSYYCFIQITKDSVVKDSTLLEKFREAVQQLHSTSTAEDLQQVHGMILTKIYYARSNEFLQGIAKLSCINSNKAVDVNVGLRDKLKCYAAEKQSTM